MEINRRAPAVARDEVIVEAPIDRVWALQTDVNSWPGWRSDVSQAELEGPLGVGSVFRWRSGGFGVVSTVREVEPGRPLKGTMQKTLEGSLSTWLGDLKRAAEGEA